MSDVRLSAISPFRRRGGARRRTCHPDQKMPIAPRVARPRQPLTIIILSADGGRPFAPSIVQTPSGQLSRNHHVALLNKLGDHKLRRWYASRAIQQGCSVAVVEHQIRLSLHTPRTTSRQGCRAKAPPLHGRLPRTLGSWTSWGSPQKPRNMPWRRS